MLNAPSFILQVADDLLSFLLHPIGHRMGIGIMRHREAMAQKVTAWAFMSKSIKISWINHFTIPPYRDWIWTPSNNLSVDNTDSKPSHLWLKIDQMGRILMAGVIDLKIWVIKTQIDCIAGLDIAVDIPVTF